MMVMNKGNLLRSLRRSIFFYAYVCVLVVALVPAVKGFSPPLPPTIRCHHDDQHAVTSISSWSSYQRSSARARCLSRTTTTTKRTALYDSKDPIVGQALPLLDVLGQDEFSKKMIQPLPSRQYPEEMRTVFLYGMPIQVPVHQAIIDDANSRAVGGTSSSGNDGMACFGHLAYKPPANDGDEDENPLVGAIGCVCEILPFPLSSSNTNSPPSSSSDDGAEAPEQGFGEDAINNAVLCRGSYRFIVRDIVQSVPFPVAIVDELVDHDNDEETSQVDTVEESIEDDDEDDDDDDDDDDYADLTPAELEQRLVQGMRDYVRQKLDESNREMSPLEQSLLEEGGMMSAERQAAEEMAAVLEVFEQYMVDECPTAADRYYLLAFIAAEMTNLENDVRREILVVTNGIERLRIVLAAVEDKVGMARARKMAASITAKSDEEEKDLKIGKPQLPPWALQIRKGMRIEYYWNEEYEWCVAEVVKDPVLSSTDDDNELIVTVHFEDDDRTRQIPFSADEKARWRPAASRGGQ